MNINVAVQTEHGLFVPVVRVGCLIWYSIDHAIFMPSAPLTCILFVQDADKKGLATIGDEVKQLALRARENSLKPADYEV